MSLAAALFYGLGGVFSSRAFRGEKLLNLAIGQQLAAGVWLTPIAVLALPRHVPSTGAMVSVLGLATPSTALAYLLYFDLLRRVGPVKTLSVTFLVPVFGILWGWWFRGEAVTANMLVGLGIILLSVALVTNVPRNMAKNPHQSR